MAKLKSKSTAKTTSKSAPKTARRSAAATAPLDEIQKRAEHVSRSIVESAQQIWHAGVGAFSRAQDEGTRMFEALVKEGMTMEKSTRDLTSGQVDKVRDAVEDRVGQARERAQDTWDRLEKVFEERVQRALNRLGVPGREEIANLTQRVDALTAELRKQAGRPAAKSTAKPAAAKPAAAKQNTGKSSKAGSASAGKATRKPAAKSAAKPAAARKTGGRTTAKSKTAATKLPSAPLPQVPGDN
jgi:poly(hydroxyalkanoate) granule-associated protein